MSYLKENITAFIFIFSPYFECKTDFFKNEDGETSGHNLRACQNSLCYTWPNVLLTLRVLEGIITTPKPIRFQYLALKYNQTFCWPFTVRASYWCGVTYFEHHQRVGESFNTADPIFCIDGFTDAFDTKRFCLGNLTNVHRTQSADVTRRHIGKFNCKHRWLYSRSSRDLFLANKQPR